MQFVNPILWTEAIDKIGARTPIGSKLNSEQWRAVPVGLRERAFFSSTVESARFLQRARDFVTDWQTRAMETLPNGATALKAGSRAEFVKQLQAFAVGEGMGPVDASLAGSLQDITSEGRLNLIFDVQNQSAQDFGYWKQGMDPDVLDEFPAQRFIREREVKQPRPVHQENENVVRLKTDLPFWLGMNSPSIGGFGVPWGPWGFGSGMGVQDEDRDLAEQLGLLAKGEQVRPVDKDFNDQLKASTQGLDDDVVAKLKESFGDQVEIVDGEARWQTLNLEPRTLNPEPGEEGGTAAGAATLESVLANLGLDTDQAATADSMTALREELKEDKPATAASMIKYIKGAKDWGALTDANIQSAVQSFLDFIPPATARQLPKLLIDVVQMGDLGSYGTAGATRLNESYLAHDVARMRRTTMHELMHWRHREGDQEFRNAIKAHFEARTAGEKIKQLPGYKKGTRGKTDKWYEAYAGRIYPGLYAGDEGLEIPTRYIEWLTFEPQKMADLWNDPDFRETMKIVLKGLF